MIAGELLERARPSGEHGNQAAIVGTLGAPFRGAARGDGQGGWWISTSVEIQLSDDVVRPDVAGWRRDAGAERPLGLPVAQRPDWICEVVSPINASVDTVKKLRLYHRARLSFYWIVDPRSSTLTAMRWGDDGYITVLSAERGEVVRAPPFEAIELAVGTLFGDDP